jgi:antitoxin CptB
MIDQAHLNRLFWHSRRGMRELDLLLVPFVQEAYTALEPADQLRYEAFLKLEDQDMFNLLMQQVEATEPDLARIIGLILAHAGRVQSAS